MKERKGTMHTTAATATPAPEGFTDAEWEKFERFQAEKERRRIAAERFKAGLTTERILLRNETGGPLSLPRGCTYGAHDLAKEISCDGTDPACRLRASKPNAAPGELFLVPPGHRWVPNPGLPEVDPASTADEPTLQDRLLLAELRSFELRAESPATLASRTLDDLEAQRRILDERILQQQKELERRQSHVQAAKAKTEGFLLGSRSPEWKEALLAGKASASLDAVKRAADEAERRRPEIHTVDDLGRLESGETGATSFKAGANGPEPLVVGRA